MTPIDNGARTVADFQEKIDPALVYQCQQTSHDNFERYSDHDIGSKIRVADDTIMSEPK